MWVLLAKDTLTALYLLTEVNELALDADGNAGYFIFAAVVRFKDLEAGSKYDTGSEAYCWIEEVCQGAMSGAGCFTLESSDPGA